MNPVSSARRIRHVQIATLGAVFVLLLATADAWAQFGGFGGMGAARPTGIFGWLLAQQAFFYRALAEMLHAAKTNGSAYWGLMGISFVYGIFHAAGPGHGKAVISSYLLANEETWRRGIALSFASAVLQSIAAVTIVSVAALVIGATAKMMGDTVRIIEIVSYALIIAVGLRLLWVKGRSFLTTLHKLRAASSPAPAFAANSGIHTAHVHDDDHAHCHHHDHTHDEDSHDEHAHHEHPPDEHVHDEHEHAGHAHAGHHHAHDDEEESVLPWGHAHGPEPEELAGPGGWRRGLSAVIAVGLRPCSGAIIILVFSLSQGLFWAGIASTFVMGLGTAITVGGIASLAVGAKSLAKRFASSRVGYGTLILRGMEVGAGGLVVLVGVALLTGYMASERMGFF